MNTQHDSQLHDISDDEQATLDGGNFITQLFYTIGYATAMVGTGFAGADGPNGQVSDIVAA